MEPLLLQAMEWRIKLEKMTSWLMFKLTNCPVNQWLSWPTFTLTNCLVDQSFTNMKSFLGWSWGKEIFFWSFFSEEKQSWVKCDICPLQRKKARSKFVPFLPFLHCIEIYQQQQQQQQQISAQANLSPITKTAKIIFALAWCDFFTKNV